MAKKESKTKTLSKSAAGAKKPGGASAPSPSGVMRQTDTRIMAIDLAPGTLSPAMEAYFKKCEEKLGFVPNVLLAYALSLIHI